MPSTTLLSRLIAEMREEIVYGAYVATRREVFEDMRQHGSTMIAALEFVAEHKPASDVDKASLGHREPVPVWRLREDD